ncbi:glycosyltransferase family 2 protein [Helicobacter marmotae]|uniref:glycosyltransferase family 2 protein n=1 Tax=Helicobacter marmotae TaxID=152490 RepID=UPI0013156F10|nr:glycosyltransferase family 2 protein [Helicobacter marmotae]
MIATNEADISIIVPSYNRASFITQCLDSILAQKCSYSYCVIIADDCSSDGSLEIIKAYMKAHSNIYLLPSKTNQKLYKNILRAYEMIKSNYFCVLDPDDYWLSTDKLQKALDFLEQHRSYSIYTGNTQILKQDGALALYIKGEARSCSFSDFLAQRAFMGHTSSAVYRNVVFKNGVPKKMRTLESESCEVSYRGDSFRNLLALHEGESYFSAEVDSVYRITSNGIFQSLSTQRQRLLNAMFYKDMYLYFEARYVELLYFAYRNYRLLTSVPLHEVLENEHIDMAYLEELRKLGKFFISSPPPPAKNALIAMRSKNTKLKYKMLQAMDRYIQHFLAKKGAC